MQSISKLHWKCRRGLKELDLLFEYFLHHHYAQSEETVQLAFEALINEQDPIIMDYLFERREITEPHTQEIIKIMRNILVSQ